MKEFMDLTSHSNKVAYACFASVSLALRAWLASMDFVICSFLALMMRDVSTLSRSLSSTSSSLAAVCKGFAFLIFDCSPPSVSSSKNSTFPK